MLAIGGASGFFCGDALVSYKRPLAVVFVELADLPRSAIGKIVREEVERMIG